MAPAQSAALTLLPGTVFRPCGRQLITLYLGRNALRGELPDADVIPGGCVVTAGVDVFAASPNALPFQPSHRRGHGEVWGYFAAAARIADNVQPASGGCWVRYGAEKRYELKGEALGYRSRYAFHVTRVEAGGAVVWAPTRWLMKEYRLDKGAAVFRSKLPEHPKANMDFVVRKVFTKPAIAVPSPARSGLLVRRVVQVPVKARAAPVHKKAARPAGPPPVPSYARPGEAVQPGGSRIPPRSARPPQPPPKVIAKPVVPAPPPKVIANANPVVLAPRAHSGEKGNLNDKVMPWTRVGEQYKVPSGRQIILEYLGPKATNGEIAAGVSPGFVAEGVDVFAAGPDALPFPPSRRKQNGEAWGYFFAAKPASSMRLAPGGCWMQYGESKRYVIGGEVLAFHRRFAFHAARLGGDGKVAWEEARWLMKEYGLHKVAATFRGMRTGPGANMDLVVYKVFFTKPAVPPPSPPVGRSGEAQSPGSDRPSVNEEAGCSNGEGQARKGAGSSSSESDEPRIVFDIDLNN